MLPGGRAFGDAMDGQELAEHRANRKARVERRVRVLENELYRSPVLPGAMGGEVGTLEEHAAAVGWLEPGNDPSEGRFATPRFANEP